MSDIDDIREKFKAVAAYLPDRDPHPPLNWKSSEQKQAEWNEIASRNLVREQGQNLIAVITKRVNDLQSALKEGQALVVYCDAGQERILVRQFEFPTWHLAIVSGVDANDNYTLRIENIQDIKLTCKVIDSPKHSAPIGFKLPMDQ